MRIAFISDIHGNAVALRSVLDDIRRQDVDQICVLGDLCYRGPDPKGSLEQVRSLEAQVIKGNADEWVARGVRQGEVPDKALELMNVERDWTVSRLDQQDLDYLESLPTELRLEAEGVTISAFHATPESLFEIVAPDTGEELFQHKLMSASAADVYVYAHIHKPFIRYIRGKVLINIGSVGLPFDGMTRASYGMIEVNEGRIRTSIERVAFDTEEVIRQYEQLAYPNSEMMARILRTARAN